MSRKPTPVATLEQGADNPDLAVAIRRVRITPYPKKGGARLWAEVRDGAPFVTVGNTLRVGTFQGVVTNAKRDGGSWVRVMAWDRAYAPAPR